MEKMKKSSKKKVDYKMKMLLFLVILLIAVPFCVVVWAGLDAAGGSLINCRTIVSDTSTVTVSDNVEIDGVLTVDHDAGSDIIINSDNPILQLNNNSVRTPYSTISFTSIGYPAAYLQYNSNTDLLEVHSADSIGFGADEFVIDLTEQKITTGTDVKFGINTENPATILDVNGTITVTGDYATAAAATSAWELDGNGDSMPVAGSFNDINYDLDSNGDLMPTILIYFESDTSGNLMPTG